MKAYKITNPLRFTTSMVILNLLIMLLVFSLTNQLKASADQEQQYIYFTVLEGDTLWTIAKEHNSKKDIREYIYNLKQINNIEEPFIYPGQELKIPVMQ